MSKLLSCADRLRAKTVGQVTPQVAHLTFTVKELLQEEGVTLTIPLWQRDYEWSKTQYKSIFSTLRDGGESPFFGNILLLQNAEKGFLVVDGQQRLCTFYKLAHALALKPLPTVQLMRGKTEEHSTLIKQNEVVEGQAEAFNNLSVDIQKNELVDVLRARLAVTVMVPPEAMMRDVKRLTSYATALFERVNTQKKALVPVDQLKARVLVTLLKENAEAAESFATAWEQLRAIVWSNGANDPDVRSSIRDGDFGTVQKLGELAAEDLRRCEMLFMRLLIGIASVSKGATDGFSLSTESLEDARASFAGRMKLGESLDLPAAKAFAEAFAETLRKVVKLLLENAQIVLLRRTDKNAENPPKLPRAERKLRLLQLQAFLEAIDGTRWVENKAFLTLLKTLVERPGDVEGAMTAVEKLLWKRMREKTDGKLDAEQHRRLVARDWFLFKALWDEESRKSFNAAISVALAQSKAKLDKTFLGKASALSTETAYVKRLPSRSGAAEIEHWVAVKSVTETEQKKIGKFINTSANYAHITNGLNQRLSNLPSQDKASVVLSKELFESCWPTLLFSAWATESLKTKGGAVEKLALLQFFEFFWAAVKEELPEG